MLKITSRELDNHMDFDVEDDTEDFDQMGMELSVLIHYAYDCMCDAARQSGLEDPEFEARQYIHAVVDNAFDEDIHEEGEERGKLLKLVDEGEKTED